MELINTLNFRELAYNDVSLDYRSLDIYEKSFYTERKSYFDEPKLKYGMLIDMLDGDEYDYACALPKQERKKLAKELMDIILEQIEVHREEEEKDIRYYKQYGNGY